MRKRILVLALIGAIFPAVALGSATTSVVKATLAGASEVPKGSPTGKGTATITLTAGKVCWTLIFKGIGTPVAAHIHKGKPGAAGPVVVPLGGAFKAKGCTAAPAAVANAIAKTPGAYYVNIHTAKFPGGAIRGQLHR